MIKKIISGGQTGVDQAALDMAVECNIPIGGWCPKGGLDENGHNILKKHPLLTESTTAIPAERTQLNVRDSDGTLIIVPCLPLPHTIKDGTQLTIDETIKLNKPCLIVNLLENELSTQTLLDWCAENNIYTLNIAGPRESSCPGIYQKSYELFRILFIARRIT